MSEGGGESQLSFLFILLLILLGVSLNKVTQQLKAVLHQKVQFSIHTILFRDLSTENENFFSALLIPREQKPADFIFEN